MNNRPTSPALEPTEFESTISIKINEIEYERAEGKTDVLFFFKDESRLSGRRIERKVFVSTKNVFGFCEGRVFPIRRTTARESLCEIDRFTEVIKSTHRKTRQLKNGIRLSYNKEECEKGVRYTVEYEIEYGGNTKHEKIVDLEDLLMTEAINNGHFVDTTEMTLENIFACVMTKVQMWHCLDATKPYIWAYKWNGVKAKMIVHEDTTKAYLWRDADNIKIVDFEGYHEFMRNLCMVVEVMDGITVVIEIIGSRFDDDCVYLSESKSNIKMLNHLRSIMLKAPMRLDGKLLVAQTYFHAPMPKYETNDDHDGFIVVQNDTVIKWKPPTVDVKCVTGDLYAVGDTLIRLDTVGEPDAIYEISPSFKIIRRRNDRITSSSKQEYQVFMQSIGLLSIAGPTSTPQSASLTAPSSRSSSSSSSSLSPQLPPFTNVGTMSLVVPTPYTHTHV